MNIHPLVDVSMAHAFRILMSLGIGKAQSVIGGLSSLCRVRESVVCGVPVAPEDLKRAKG